jgi:hypothetical protein
MAKGLGFEITPGTLGTCEACAAGKKKRNIPKVSTGQPAAVGQNQIYLDISTVKRHADAPKAIKLNWIQFGERVTSRQHTSPGSFLNSYSKTVPAPTAANATSGLDDHGNSEPVRRLGPSSGDDNPPRVHEHQWRDHWQPTTLSETLSHATTHLHRLPLYHLLHNHCTPYRTHSLVFVGKPTCY